MKSSIYKKQKDEPTMEGIPAEEFFRQLKRLKKQAKTDPVLKAIAKAAYDDMQVSFYGQSDSLL